MVHPHECHSDNAGNWAQLNASAGYSIFVIRGSLPECEADQILRIMRVEQQQRPKLIGEDEAQRCTDRHHTTYRTRQESSPSSCVVGQYDPHSVTFTKDEQKQLAVQFVNCLKPSLKYLFLLAHKCACRVATDIFWKGWTNFEDYDDVRGQIEPHQFPYNSPEINTLKKQLRVYCSLQNIKIWNEWELRKLNTQSLLEMKGRFLLIAFLDRSLVGVMLKISVINPFYLHKGLRSRHKKM